MVCSKNLYNSPQKSWEIVCWESSLTLVSFYKNRKGKKVIYIRIQKRDGRGKKKKNKKRTGVKEEKKNIQEKKRNPAKTYFTALKREHLIDTGSSIEIAYLSIFSCTGNTHNIRSPFQTSNRQK